MMAETTDTSQVFAAMADFRRARRQAALQEIIARLTGAPIDLLSFEDIRQKFKISSGSDRGLQEIPLDAIVGSVGRYHDFTRGFLPRQDSDEHRWAGVKSAALDFTGLPPIEVYKIGDVYFVLDGNHRVSVARQLGATHIEAYVTEFKTRVPLSPGDKPDDLIIKAEYADFLEHTHLDKLRPGADLRVTAPGRYMELEAHIEAHRFLKGQEQNREIPREEAIADWYDNVYLPLVHLIRERGILHDFPDRTETDLYLWLFRHRLDLERKLGWQIAPEVAAANLAAERGSSPERVTARVEAKLTDAILPESLSSGPAPGQWRRELLATRPDDRLFSNLLVPISGSPASWQALDQALIVAEREKSRLYGLHLVASAEDRQRDEALAVQAEFKQRCQAAGIQGELTIEAGPIARKISERARWVDLVIMHLAHPPGSGPLLRLSSGFRTVLYRCPRPVLTVPGSVTSLQRALLAYDESPKAQEGLFVATYLAGQWQIPLVVVNVLTKTGSDEILNQAQVHLERRGVTASLVSAQGPVGETILQTAAEHQCDLIIMGGYSSTAVVEVVLGSAVDQVLRESRLPMMICR